MQPQIPPPSTFTADFQEFQKKLREVEESLKQIDAYFEKYNREYFRRSAILEYERIMNQGSGGI